MPLAWMTVAEARGAVLAATLLALAGGLGGAPPRDAPPARAASSTAAAEESGPMGKRMDINRADATALTALPGIGPVLAERIVSHRLRHGPFESVADLASVRGVGPRLIERIRDRVTVQSRPDSLLQ
jgi:competence protein ComEA